MNSKTAAALAKRTFTDTTQTLGNGVTITVDPEDSELIRRPWTVANGYAFRNDHGRMTMLHRVICERSLGRPLVRGEEVDHANRKTLDNRRSNLRVTTHQRNLMNQGPSKGRRYKGVFRRPGGTFFARIRFDGQLFHLGSFSDAEEAAYMYDQFALALFGEYAYLNTLQPQ